MPFSTRQARCKRTTVETAARHSFFVWGNAFQNDKKHMKIFVLYSFRPWGVSDCDHTPRARGTERGKRRVVKGRTKNRGGGGPALTATEIDAGANSI